MFSETGNLRGVAIHNIIIVLMPLIMSIACETMPVEYCTFFLMFSCDITQLFRLYFRNDDEIDDLYLRIVETVAIHEGMFPIYESKFAYHQLLDFAKFIKDMSIVKGWSCLASERQLPYIKKCLPRGGRNSDKTLMEVYGPFENSKCFKAYAPTDAYDDANDDENDDGNDDANRLDIGDVITYKNGKMYYNCYAYSLLKKSHISTQNYFDNRFNSYETDCLYKILIYEIKKKTNSFDEALQLSPTFRLYWLFTLHANKKYGLFFFDFLKDNISSYSHYGEENDFCNTVNIVDEINIEDIKKGKIYVKDIDFCESLLDVRIFQNKIFRKAIICGFKMVGRGFNYRETALPSKNFDTSNYGSVDIKIDPSNDLNVLKLNWCNSMDILSSWCKVQKPKSLIADMQLKSFDWSTKKTEIKNVYAQMNFFFRVVLPDDILLHGTMICSITARKAEVIKYVNCIQAEENNSLMQEFLFCSAADIYSSKVLVGAIDNSKNKLPFMKKENAISPQGCSKEKTSNLSHLILIDLHPNRDCLIPTRKDFRNQWKHFHSFNNDNA
jgi:hypothetical protein